MMKMNRRGFTLIELLGSLMLLAIILGIGLYFSKGTLATSLLQLDLVSDSEVMDSANLYSIEKDLKWVDGSVCVKVSDLIDYGYLSQSTYSEIGDRIVKLTRNKRTRVLEKAQYVDSCE